ncbi:Pr6Pr family membrane protein [Spongiactinospora sp. TRM90649]|uniref:Pr6Pr family membrane protein n=1 Tax=Spongiactinospora sp. TRM90649 TaxID=3031114 RepID=UPI0023F8F2CF|nr:Pr6Pr family membrane protein [Spongiactinospora sp. TRM90649]MDF5752508.1 Pr6Pr family membrane protein [Spongiactinospora sp. TRM90649]
MRLLWRGLLVATAIAGLVFTWLGAVHPLDPPIYFTVQSNIAFTAHYAWRLSGHRDDGGTLRGAIVLYLVITALVAHFILGNGASPLRLIPDGDAGDMRDLGNLLLHYATPAMALADWVTTDRDQRPRWSAPLLWLAYPALYVIFVLIRGALLAPGTPKRYPYPFVNVDVIGYDGLAVQVVFFGFGFAALGYALLGLHRLISLRPVAAEPSPQVTSSQVP